MRGDGTKRIENEANEILCTLLLGGGDNASSIRELNTRIK